MISQFKKHSWKWSIVALVLFIGIGFIGLTNSKSAYISTKGKKVAETKPKPKPKQQGQTPPKKAMFDTITLGKNEYQFSFSDRSEQYFVHAVMTSRGIIWNPAPPTKGSNLDLHPTEPFTLYLSPTDKKQLDIATSKKVFTLPLIVHNNNTNEKLYTYLGGLIGLDQWVIYSTYVKSPGMNQPMYSELHAFDLDTQKDTFITQYHDAGGYQFSIATANQLVFYVKGSFDPKGNSINHGYVYNLEKNTSSALKPAQIKNNTIHYLFKGSVLHMKLQPF